MTQAFKSSRFRNWVVWLAINFAVLGYYGYAFVAPASPIKAALLPGETTHGHYQIELDCNACHDPVGRDEKHSADNVMTDACNRCHGAQLKGYDTHPAKKFNDLANAPLLEIIDAKDCLTCHTEHVPHRTLPMGLTMPSDYCFHCHKDVADDRPSHEGMAFDSCATAGCHNYHDNRAIYEKYLDDHFGEPDFREVAVQPARDFLARWQQSKAAIRLTRSDADGPKDAGRPRGADGPEGAGGAEDRTTDLQILTDWAETAHAAAGVNCSGCHVADGQSGSETANWSDQVAMSTCAGCHDPQVTSFQQGKHGMRLAAGMTPMTPEMARLPMKEIKAHQGAAHQQLDCSACHSGHRFDTQYAAVTACQGCHADSHSLAYASTSHADLWAGELAGELPAGSGVSCATCHLPRLVDEDHGGIWVNHDQDAVLRPNETMARQVCGNCHGLDFSLSSLADPDSMLDCYGTAPTTRIDSVQMAHDYFEERRQRRKKRSGK